jgi:glutathionylspermidine amidase/synthetase
MAYDIFYLNSVKKADDSHELLPLHSFYNGAKRRPEPGCMLIWEEGGHFDVTGHVAIVVEVSDVFVRIIEQNVFDAVWPSGQNHSRQLKAEIKEDGSYWIVDDFFCDDTKILGWVIQTESKLHAVEFAPPSQKLLNLKRFEIPVTPKMHEVEWIDESCPDEKEFAAYHGTSLVPKDAKSLVYYGISESAMEELVRATNELHALFLVATRAVINDDNFLEKCGIPELLWPKIRQSWEYRNKQTVSGRFDFSMSDRGIKAFEFNADSAACLMECGKIQGKWCKAVGVTAGEDPGEDVFERLEDIWERIAPKSVVHLFQDDNAEETYHTLYMKSAMESAGLSCKVIRSLDSLSWSPAGDILDEEDTEIRFIWKTWAWETVLGQLRQEMENDDCMCQDVALGHHRENVRLMDVLLHPAIKVFEPLWTMVTNNKFTLSVLHGLAPKNKFLLRAESELSEELKPKGYVVKPIAGRAGENIQLLDGTGAVLASSGGQFDYSKVVYQELHTLPRFGEDVVQVSTFVIGGKYAGTVLRTDRKLIMDVHSPVVALRILDDEEWNEESKE